MGKSLFITEKPSVAMEFAKAINVPAQGRGNGYIENDKSIITWCVGHLVTMSYPDAYDEELKKWSLDTIPFVPKTFRYEIINDVKKQYNIVAKLLNRKDVDKIYYSGDSAREGEYIQRLVRQKAGHNPNAAEYRVWIDSQTKDEILKGIREAKQLSEYDKLSDSAYARAIEDYLVGMNFSRALSLKYSGLISNAVGDKYHPIAVGRVMSCVLGMIVQREREIRNAVIFPFYGIRSDISEKVHLDWKIVQGSRYFESPEAYNDTGLLKRELAEALTDELNRTGNITITERRENIQKKSAPLLYNLAELQADCTKMFHISPADALAIAQSLYEKKLTTYPRTDARVLTTAICKEFDKNIRGLSAVPEVSAFSSEIMSKNMYVRIRDQKTKYVDDSKVSDHYAIIPTGEGFENLSSLTELEKKVYLAICRRFLSIFYPDAEIDKLTITGVACKETFTATFQAIHSEGYLKVAGYKDETESKAAYQEARALNGTVNCQYSVKEGKTQPPKRYTSGSMILAMENAGNLIDDQELREQIKGSGIGTSATRAEVITKLERNKYIAIDKKTQAIRSAELGELIYDVLKEACPQILNPKYTASWESGLQGIVDGKVTKDHYLEKIYQYVISGTNSMKSTNYTDAIRKSIQELSAVFKGIKVGGYASEKKELSAACPYCGKQLKSSEKGVYCVGYKEGCKFSLFRNISGKSLSDSVLVNLISSCEKHEDLVSSHETDKIDGFKSKKTGKSFGAKIKLSGKIGEYPRMEFIFDKR